MPKKKNPTAPKPRHGWSINPKTRVTPSKKNDLRKILGKSEKDWVDELLD